MEKCGVKCFNFIYSSPPKKKKYTPSMKKCSGEVWVNQPSMTSGRRVSISPTGGPRCIHSLSLRGLIIYACNMGVTSLLLKCSPSGADGDAHFEEHSLL